MAPKKQKPTRETEQGAQAPSSGTLVLETIETMATPRLTDGQQLAAAQEEIRQLQEQLDLIQNASRTSTPSTNTQAKLPSVKLKDPEPLTDGSSPSFNNWKIQMEDKFLINASMFELEEAKMAYVFNRTADTAQKHLAPRYRKGPEPFSSANEMITYLAEILENPFEAQDARTEFRELRMRNSETFADFYTRFLHLAGTGRIPTDDLQPDLYDKLTPALQQAVMPFLDVLLTSTELANKCRLVDKNLRRLQIRQAAERTTRFRSRPVAAPTFTAPAVTFTASKPMPRTASPAPVPGLYGPARQATPVRKDPEDACYKCKKPGHFARDCPDSPKPATGINELTESPVPGSDSKEESGNDQV